MDQILRRTNELVEKNDRGATERLVWSCAWTFLDSREGMIDILVHFEKPFNSTFVRIIWKIYDFSIRVLILLHEANDKGI